jgi:hypothetical protein
MPARSDYQSAAAKSANAVAIAWGSDDSDDSEDEALLIPTLTCAACARAAAAAARLGLAWAAAETGDGSGACTSSACHGVCHTCGARLLAHWELMYAYAYPNRMVAAWAREVNTNAPRGKMIACPPACIAPPPRTPPPATQCPLPAAKSAPFGQDKDFAAREGVILSDGHKGWMGKILRLVREFEGLITANAYLSTLGGGTSHLCLPACPPAVPGAAHCSEDIFRVAPPPCSRQRCSRRLARQRGR